MYGTNSSIQVEWSGFGASADPEQCTLTALTFYGLPTTSMTFQAPMAMDGNPHIGALSIPSTSNTAGNEYVLTCSLPSQPNETEQTQLLHYRAAETDTATFEPGQTYYPSSICAPSQQPYGGGTTLQAGGALRYFTGALVNESTGSMTVDCPVPDTFPVPSTHIVYVALTESTSTAHSSCALAIRNAWDNTVVAEYPANDVTNAGPQRLTMTSNDQFNDNMRFNVECFLSPGSAVNSVTVAPF
jgi:hypothetical protein